MNRETWLLRAVPHLARHLAATAGVEVPAHYVSVGFPKGLRGRQSAVGQCWSGTLSRDGRPHVFVTPETEDPVYVLETLVHEMIHVTVGTEAGHRGEFVRVARAAGLVRPWKDAPAGPETRAALEAVAARLGPYPHSALTPRHKAKKPGSRMRLFECECGVKVRAGRDVLNATCDDCGTKFERSE